ncbi:ADP-ribosylglycohydrolase family protein [Shewanella sp. OMA3-2]|uniref:ADP-ribosylglycohydrolase family protein n=1 Tax=Shewanella sp. OMA3-2 TaxID=2908650 RepID=UPI001F2A7FBA|nr:ADP-ribosylglycohydrolase family protein [Shewanella sp. OMA3-2]UJF20500.1 ADP-ribosylglycohydrolase family protein [Shewanella sp. OMA3-2]
MIRLEEKIPNDLRFPFMTNKLSGSREPHKTQWMSSYFVFRIAKPTPTDEECKGYYQRINVDSEDDINRFRGALIGCAIGDALGTTVEFKAPGSFPPLTDIVGGGPFNLKAGEWTDDTSMMYCLAHSLIRTKQCDLKDQMDLYCRWWQDGVFSATGKCFDIGNTVVSALKRYQQTGDPLSGDTAPMSAGNGSLMRIAPIPIRYFNNFENTIKYAALSSMTTHGAIEAVDACRYFSGLMWGALHGISKDVLLNGLYTPIDEYWEQNPLCDSVLKLIKEEEYKNKKAKDIRASGYVMHTLEAVLWAFFHSDSFEKGALLAVNLGEDADTTGAVYGQLAGAYYGERVIDFRWVRKIKESHCFYLKAEELKDIIISERAI